ncbi:MAG: HupE/UreJ family protein [Actinomycetota bacterium]
MKSAVRAVIALIAGALVLGLFPASADAHAGDQAYVYLNVSVDQLGGQVEYPFGDVEEIWGIDLGDDRDANAAAVESVLPELLAHVDEHFDIGADGELWAPEFGDYLFLTDNFDVDIDYVIFPFDVEIPERYDEVPQVIEVRFDPFFEEIPNRDALLLIANDYGRGVIENEASELRAFEPGSEIQEVDLGDSSQWTNFTSSIGFGIDHIRTGPDHIFFVFVLLLPSVLVWSASRWWPVEGFTSSLWRVLKLVTMFTVAHSITFTLAGLGVLPLPDSKIVETIIALSIAAAALNNVRPVLPNKEWLIAGAFGLFHGMGFASLVADLPLDRTTELVSLVGRNVGIEIGQVIVVLITFPLLFLLRRTVYYRPLFITASIGMAVVSIGWMFERLFERDLGYNGAIDRVVQWPRSLIVLVVLTAIAAALFKREEAAGRLLDTRPDDAADDSDPSTGTGGDTDAESEPLPV